MPQRCLAAEGSGCLAPDVRPAACDSGPGETGTTRETGGQVAEGGAAGCSHVPVAAPALWLTVLVVLARRAWPLAWLAPQAAWAMDGSGPRFGQGGAWATTAGGLHAPWSLSGGLGAAWTSDPVVLTDGSSTTPLLHRVITTDLGLAITIGSHVEVRADVPVHSGVVLGGESEPPAPGDVGLDVALGIAPRLAFDTWVELPSQVAGPWLTDRGVVGAGLSGEAPLARGLTALAAGGLVLQDREELPGTVWGSHAWATAGLSHAAGRAARVGVEATAAAPTTGSGTAASWPVEVLPWLRAGSAALGVKGGAGLGVGHGLGAPRARVFLAVDWALAARDPDGDGYPGPRDLCPRAAEDRDRFHDWNGCPDPDDDRDGFADAVDACPEDPETSNGFLDDDGCPDAAASLRATVEADEPLEAVRVALGDAPPEGLLAGEAFERTVAPGPRRLVVTSPGWEPAVLDLDLREGGNEVAVTLRRAPSPPELPPGVEIRDDIRFLSGSDALGPGSAPVLDALADWLLANPEVTLLRVEGHADDTGPPAFNYDLSIRRAQAVAAALVDRGVDDRRLVATGAGEALATTVSAADRAVTFLVLVWTGAPAPPPGPARDLFSALPDAESAR